MATGPDHVHIAVVCITHRSGDLMADFAAALPAAAGELTTRTVVVDSGSPDDTCAAVRHALPDAVVYRLETNQGFAAAINEGVRRIRETGGADAVLIVNPDIRLAPGCLPALFDVLSDPAVGVAVPRLVDEHGQLLWSLRRAPSVAAAWSEALLGGPTAARLHLPSDVIRDPHAYEHVSDVGWATGGMILVAMRTFEIVGEWDESYFLYEEEVDFLLRTGDAGLAVRYTPAAEATRIVGSGGLSPWVNALMAVNRVAHLRRRPDGRTRAPAVRAALLVANTLRLLRGRRESYPAIWALLRGSRGPQVVMDRLLPAARADVQAPLR